MATKSQEPVIGDGSLHVGDRVVYPNQGICRITGVETKQIAGQDWEVVTLSREEDSATVMVPKVKVMGIGLRKVAQAAEIDKVFDLLASPSDDPQLDWKVRHRENADRMSGGGLMGTVEVLKGLNALARLRPLPAKERELYDNARHLLIGEVAAAMNLPNHVAEDHVDYALWPPEGMTRKGRALEPATLGPPPPRAASGEDEDLGFEDEEEREEEAPAAAAGGDEGEAAGEDEEEAPKAKPAKKPAKPAAPPKAAPRAEEKPAPAAAVAAAPAHAPAKKPAHAPPKPAAAPKAKSAAVKKAAPAKKPAAKKAAPAKKPAAAKAKKPAAAPKKAKGRK